MHAYLLNSHCIAFLFLLSLLSPSRRSPSVKLPTSCPILSLARSSDSWIPVSLWIAEFSVDIESAGPWAVMSRINKYIEEKTNKLSKSSNQSNHAKYQNCWKGGEDNLRSLCYSHHWPDQKDTRGARTETARCTIHLFQEFIGIIVVNVISIYSLLCQLSF